jgi:hypothetical protein
MNLVVDRFGQRADKSAEGLDVGIEVDPIGWAGNGVT